MRKVLIALAAIFLLLAGGGYFGVQYVKKEIADRVMDEVIEQVLRDEEVRRLLDDPEVRQALREAAAEEDPERLLGELGAQPGGLGSVIAGPGGSDAGTGEGEGVSGAGPEAGGDLPVMSLEEAEALVLEKFSIGEIRRYAAMARGGLTEEEKRLIRDEALGRFTEDEWRALRLVALIEAERRSGTGK
jgi:hypothetical protein